LIAKKQITQADSGKAILLRIVSMLEALAKPLQALGIRVQEARVQAGIVI
jgi:hypothetical protein